MWTAVKFLFIIGAFAIIAWAVISKGGYSQPGARPGSSITASTDFIRNEVFSGTSGNRAELAKPAAPEPVYVPSTPVVGTPASEEDSAAWNNQYPEGNKPLQPADK